MTLEHWTARKSLSSWLLIKVAFSAATPRASWGENENGPIWLFQEHGALGRRDGRGDGASVELEPIGIDTNEIGISGDKSREQAHCRKLPSS